MFERAPQTLAAWTSWFARAEVPVLRATIDAIQVLADDEDAVNAHQLADVVQRDPLMTLKVLAFLGMNRPRRMLGDAETVTAAIVLMGVPPFFRRFADLKAVEDQLAGEPEALDGLHAVLRRSHRAAGFAIGFAVLRKDTDAEMIHEAALLHDFAELLLWCHAPRLALEIRRRQAADPTLRSAAIQRELLHIQLADLEQALMKAWQLPAMLMRITDDQRVDDPQVRNVLLAMQLARHSQAGWDNAALPDDYRAIGQLVGLSPAVVRSRILEFED